MPAFLLKKDEQVLTTDTVIEIAEGQSQLNLEIAWATVSDQNRFEYAYRQNDDWKTIDNYQSLFIDVPYGSSILEFKVQNKVSGNSQIQRLQLQRNLPFWLSTWFQVLLALGGLLILVGIYFLIKYLRTRKLLKHESEQRKITQERLRISRELHDNIGARLTHIISSLDIELYKTKDDSTAIEGINAFAKETMMQLREAIWAVGDKTIYYSEFAARVEQYLTQADKLTSIDLLFQNDSNRDFELNALQTINYYRLMQEAVNNAVKYSQASQIKVRLHQEQGYQYLTITDNGEGFDSTRSKNGSGLNGMRNRAEEAGGSCAINSSLQEGTVVQAKFRFE